tara:strand:+ start:805 stop:1227 length:423 start_codon:yes stop_codon:yes gene_type:complete
MGFSPEIKAEDSQMPKYEQCILMPSSYSDNANQVLSEGTSFSMWCELCGDKKPGPIQTVNSLSIEGHDENFSTVSINGEVIDTAYLYVYMNGAFTNFGTAFHCNPVGVSERIYAWPHILSEMKRIQKQKALIELASRNGN